MRLRKKERADERESETERVGEAQKKGERETYKRQRLSLTISLY